MADARTVILTGATRGMGRAMVGELAAAGHTVIGCGRNADHVRELQQQHAASHDFTTLDVTDVPAVTAWAQRVLANHGAPDLLLNNAALMNTPAPLWEVPVDEFEAVIDVNIKGVANLIRAFAPAMIDAGRGVIVNFSSGWGRSTSPEVAPYCTTKWAIEGLSRAVSQELPDGLACVAVSPGVVDTDMLRKSWGSGAAGSPSPDRWATSAVPWLLELGARDNGKSLTTP